MSGSGPTRTYVDPSQRLASGSKLASRYRVEELLGVGGMGIVYKAHDEELGVDVALKVLRPELAVSEERVERLRREVLLARKVSHRAVVRTHDIGQDAELRFVTMDYVAGLSLRALLEREKRLAPERAEAIARGVAEALAAAHDEGVVHRDLTPANVLVGEDDRVWITDFGLARSLGGGGPTRTGAVLGTLDYLSPEQARGEEADGRSDLFALGVLLFEMLTGELPFRGGTWSEVLAQRLHAAPRELAASGVRASPRLARVVRRCLEREPRRRYATARELLRDLDGELRLRPRAWLPLAGAVLVALASTATILLVRRAGDPPPLAAMEPAAAPAARRALAVLPLHDETGRGDLAWLGGAVAERLTEALGSDAALQVVSSERVAAAVTDLRLGGAGWREAELRQLAELFDVERVVAGVVRRSGEQLLVELRLADRSGGELAVARRLAASAGLGELERLTGALVVAVREGLELEPGAAGESPAGAAAPGRSPAAYAAFAEGSARLVAGDALAAVGRLEEAVEADPAFAAAWLRLAEALEAQGHVERALAAAERAAALLEGSTGRLAREARARRAGLLGEPERARELLGEIAAAFPNDVEAAVAHAEAAGELGELELAESELARAVALDPRHPRAWYLRGKYAILAGRARAAVDEHLVRALVLQNSLRNEQGRADVLNAFGVGYRQLGELDRAFEQYEQAADLRRSLDDRRGLATTLRNLAGIEAVRGRLDEAEARLGEAQAILDELGDRAGLADLHNERGVLAEERGRAAAALEEYRLALELRRKLGDQRGTAESLNNVGYAYFLLGEYDNARAFWQQALELHRSVGNVEGEVLTLQSAGQLALVQGEWEEAARDFLSALETSRAIGLEPAVAVSNGNLGRLAAYQGRFDAAFASFEEARRGLERLGDPRGLAEFALAEAEAWLELERVERAFDRLDAAERWLDGGNHEQRAELLALRAQAAAARGETEAARGALEHARSEATASGSRAAVARVELAAGLVAQLEGRTGAARGAFGRAIAAAVALDHAGLELRAREGAARAALAAGEPGAAEVELRAALRRADRCGAFAGRWRLHALLARAIADSDAEAADAERSRARQELARILESVEPGLRDGIADGEAARALG